MAETAISIFGSIDALVNNAGIFFTKPFTDYTAEDFKRLVSTNLGGFIYITQLAIKQMLMQKSGGSIVSITASLADNPIAGVNASVPMITKGGIDAITRSLAIEYAKDGIRVNAVAPGVVDTPLHKNSPKDFLKRLSPMGSISTVQEIVDAVIYLTEVLCRPPGFSAKARRTGTRRHRAQARRSPDQLMLRTLGSSHPVSAHDRAARCQAALGGERDSALAE